MTKRSFLEQLIQLYPENIFYTDYDCYNLRNRMIKKNNTI